MKLYHSLLLTFVACLLAFLVFWPTEKTPEAGSRTADKPAAAANPVHESADAAPIENHPHPPHAAYEPDEPLAGLADVPLPKRADLSWGEPMSGAAFEEFRRWTESLPAAASGAGLQKGIELARQRRDALRRLIEKNPQRALEFAVPHAVRQQLPQQIVALLEHRIDASGDLAAVATTLDGDRGCRIDRKVTLQDGRVFDAYTYGRRRAMPTRDNIAIHGVALDGKLALSEFAGRALEPSEVAARLEAGQVLDESAESADNTEPADAADGVVIAFGDDRIIRYADEIHAIAALLGAEGAEQSGATAALAGDLDGVIAASPWTEGQKTLLIIRVDFPDAQGQVVSDATLGQLIANMNAVYTDMSSGKSSFALLGQGSTITPTVRMPQNSSNYSSWTSLTKVLNDARAAAAAAGYNYLDYTHEVVVTGPTPVVAGTAGVARVGARGAWLHNSQWNLKTCAHEVGHNFGLPHSGAWDTDDGSVIGPGDVWEYGNVFDMMGVGSSPHASRHFGAGVKNFLDWVPDSDLVKITTDGTTTTRIRAMDKVQADGNLRGLAVERPGSTRDYWVEHRQLYGTTHGMRDGVLVNWADINGGYQQPLLLDMKPDTFQKDDAVLSIGRTFSDSAAAVHITPVSRGTDPDGVNWIDVTVTRGNVPGNLQPTASLGVTNSNPAVNGSVTFTCTASDPNGDTLAYFWDWGNNTTTTTNSPVASKSWPQAGIYVVQCTVSDMKGLATTADYVIQVGGTGTYFIEGVVSTIQGPRQGLVVSVSPTQKDTTDALGRYIIGGLTAGTYTVSASSATPDGFTNPVTVGPSQQDINFYRESYLMTWDANTGSAGAQDGGGTWANASGNWHNASTGANNRNWGNANFDSATFGAGTDGTYAVALSGTVKAGGGITFANSGYTLSGAALELHDGTGNTTFNVDADKTATMNSTITYLHNKPAEINVSSGAVLNLGGGASNSQYNFNGLGGVNITAGTYTANVGRIATADFNLSGGAFNITPANNVGFKITSNSRSVNFTHSGGAISVNGNASTDTVNNAYLSIGNGTGISNTSTMTLTNGATLNVGTNASRSGEIRIANTPPSNGTLDVQGGTLTVGTGSAENKIYFFKAGTIDAPYLARMVQSGGTVIANGIQFGADSGSYDPASSAVLQLSGGNLYVGAQGITRGSAANDLAVEILLQGGTLGANRNWSSSLDMQLGTDVTVLAEDTGGTARNITLSGKLSDDGEVIGSLIKTGSGRLSLAGANTYDGGVTILDGTLDAKVNNTSLGTGAVSMGGAGSTGATFITGLAIGNAFNINAPDSGSIVIGANGVGSGYTLSGGITMNSDLTIQTYDNTINGMITARGTVSGGITGNGNLVLNNIGLAANRITLTNNAINHSGSITVQGTATGDTTIHSNIGANVTSLSQNSATSTLVLSGNNAYTGPTTVSAGTLALTAGSTASPITIASGAKLELSLGSTINSSAALTFAAGHSISISGTPTLDSYTLFTTSGAISGTPQLTSAIPDYELQVVGGNELRLVNNTVDPYDLWSGGAAFDADANGDGVSNGMAFLLGAADTSVDARSLLPGVSRSGGNLVLTFSMRNAANRGTSTLSVQHSGDLGFSDPWTTVLVPDVTGGPTDGVTFSVVEGDPLNSVTVTIYSSEAAGGKLFGRLSANQ